MKSLLGKSLVAAAAAVALMGTAAATTLNGGLTPGVLNTIEDQDREAFVDANRDGLLSVGDVFVGFVRIDNFLPKGVSANNQVYAVISNQITGFDPAGTGDNTLLTLGTTTVPGLRLQDLTGNAATAGSLFAVYDRPAPYATDLINAAPGGATSIFDYINFITANGTLQLTAGIVAADDYLIVDNGPSFAIGAPTSLFPILPTSATVNSFGAGLSIIFNNTGFNFADAVVTVDALGNIRQNQLGVANGATRGGLGEGREAIWGNAPGFQQCQSATGAPVSCGFVTDADFFAVPIQRVPEPGSMALLGASLLGLAGARRFVRKGKA